MNTNNVSVSRELLERVAEKANDVSNFVEAKELCGCDPANDISCPLCDAFLPSLRNALSALDRALAQPSEQPAKAEQPGAIPANVCALCYHDKADAKECKRPDCEEQPGDAGDPEVDRIVERLTPIAGTAVVTNEMKARFIGEFSWQEEAPYYDEDGKVVEHTATRVVPWDLCKRIYKEMATFAAPPANDEAVRRDALRWQTVRNHMGEADWRAMTARCTTSLALDRYVDARIDTLGQQEEKGNGIR